MRRKTFSILLLSALSLVNLHAQGISGIVNSYYAITDVFPSYIQAGLGEDLGSLQPGDKVVLMQMSGVVVNSGSGFENSDQNYADLLNAGRYEMLSVKSVNNISKRVEFTVTLDDTKFTDGEKLQLIKIYEADYATVEAGLTAMPWDGTKGGVLALVVFKKLTLEADINLSGSGFRGASTAPVYTAGCKNNEVYYFSGTSPDSAGRKGEGPIMNSWTHFVGMGKVVTGGGGGIGLYAGGGGGGHFGQGGTGGDQQASCGFQWSASGGLALNEGNFYGSNRVTMGGGGGASTESAVDAATAGGNGGGIVIILADTLEANSYAIINNGMDVSTTAQAGGGGGGAGGSILLDVNVYTNAINLSVEGGIGGSTGSLQTGAGGGGGGVIWHAGTSLSPNISYSISGATGGNPQMSDINLEGGNGVVGGIVDELELPLHGFLFNSLVGGDTICENQQPEIITGSMPKGGQAAYVYSWLQSTDEVSWSAALGSGDSLSFQPDTLAVTTYFKRLIVSGDVSDTSLSIEVFVYDAIGGYAIALRDTLCSGESPGVLSGGSLSGGDGNYSYQWQSTTNQAGWTNRGATSTLNEGALTQTTFYRRFVYSAKVCTVTSNIDTISIIPVIVNNTILSGDTAICESLDGGTILAETPSGGDGIYRYQWQLSDDDLSYSDIPGETAINYSKGVLTTPKYYRRIVYSGADDACVSITAPPHFINVYSTIVSNSISTDSSLYCEGDVARIFTGEQPGGGLEGSYAYSWLEQLPGQAWEPIEGAAGVSYTPTTDLTDSMLIRRVVISGQYSACVDTSNVINVDVIPAIINNLTSADEAICEASIPVAFSESTASGGVGGITYLWEFQEEGSSTWSSALEDISPNDQVNYSSPALEKTTLYRRTVQSNICINNSNSVTITVFPFIENNIIRGGEIQYNCFNSAVTLNSPVPGGGDQSNMVYAWQQANDGSSVWSAAAGTNTAKNYTSVALRDSIYFRRLIESGPAAQCKDTSKAVLIRINPLPTGDIVSSIDTLCAGDEIAISYENLTGNSPWNISIGETTALHTETGITTPSGQFNISLNESYTLRILELSDDSTCLADLSGNSGRINAISFEVPVANAGANIEACELQTTLAAVPSVGDGLWSGTGMLFDNSSSPTTAVTSNNYGMNILTWTETNWECESSQDVEVTFFETPSDAKAGEDQTLDNFYSTTISAAEPVTGTGSWSVPEGNGTITDPNLASTEVSFEGPGTYTLLWTINNGVCEATTDDLIISIGELKQYTGFSPNGDGINDFFTLRFPGNSTVELLIYDQWGGLVYSISEENATELFWDGTYNGRFASQGTYFYIVKENGRVTKNYLELRR